MGTFTPQNAVDYCKAFAHGIPVQYVQALACDAVNKVIWRYYPWSWSIKNLTATNWVNGVQDYTITGAWISVPISVNQPNGPNYGGGFPIAASPSGLSESGSTVTVNLINPHNLALGTSLAGTACTISGAGVNGYNGTLTLTTVPSTTQIVGTITTTGLTASGATGHDIFRPLMVTNARLDTTPAEYRECRLLANLSPELTWQGGLETNTTAGWKDNSFFRYKLCCQVGVNQIMQLQGNYQFNCPKITDDAMGTALLMSDQYFDVFTSGLQWKFYQLGDDPRAGSVQVTKAGAVVMTGKLGDFYDALQEAARTEDLSVGDEQEFPEQSLGVGRDYWSGLFSI